MIPNNVMFKLCGDAFMRDVVLGFQFQIYCKKQTIIEPLEGQSSSDLLKISAPTGIYFINSGIVFLTKPKSKERRRKHFGDCFAACTLFDECEPFPYTVWNCFIFKCQSSLTHIVII